ncbi:GNAT family N-acetyltransferase [Niastella sp. OAS944]|uniref:GNAT family N-acetyltransferase n=1 Tax=Niastella sp. OAS944 TaxID=2664089 RepID=UPI00349B4390|nr:ribosomal-protein-alanine N-acetyltransferase [Chitinophagaceae bacterium OAS944]
MVIFETDRLVIRRYTLDDEENFFNLNGDPEVMKYIREPKSRQECSIFLKRNLAYYEQQPLLGRWAMIEKASNEFCGSFAVIPVETADANRHSEIQLGYALLKDHWGKGYATESTVGGMQYAFDILKLPVIVAITDTANIASQKVLLRSGFEQQPDIMEANRPLCYFKSKNPNVIETERLHLFPLTISQLELYLNGRDGLEQLLGLTPFGRTVAPQVRDRVTNITLPKMREARDDDYLFHTFWLVVDKTNKTIVAELGFKGPPMDGGRVEIGYGTMPPMQGKGYMTEAVNGILQWAAARKDVSVVLVETNADNKASIRVVEKNGFEMMTKQADNLYWKKLV